MNLLLGYYKESQNFFQLAPLPILLINFIISKILNLNTYDIAFLHIGTLLSIIVYYRKRILDTFYNIEIFTNSLKVISVALIPAVAVGLFSPLQEIIDSNKDILQITGVAYLLFSIILLSTRNLKGENNTSFAQRSGNDHIGQVGPLAQAFALVPGVSRSGVTLLTGMYLGIKKTEAIYFSLLLGIPTIFGAWLLTFVESSFTFNTAMLLPSIVALKLASSTDGNTSNVAVNSKSMPGFDCPKSFVLLINF